ncbi:MAG: competence/damage-inducible protein A [Thiohalocapsa sp.]|jgi:molybdopterin-biosynthesis enzyme MoeA-like protein|uniref:competence/damage-inducible protein A n=1 Tax=Thiohalocapsa sp. TaxID=2497641 RepID=UPI0025F99BDC|nr:molybdopterin-binding protein [Thiohalocapsa sp.]MCG6942350.1 competence/damage-inducible protein A [Thiohalocapsa sp.]
MSTAAPAPGRAFGLIVIGDEILTGARTDKHLPVFKAMLAGRGHGLAWCWILPDDPPLLTRQLAASMDAGLPVFCCGGIGATPDDHTRACAAAAAGVGLVRHPEALALIEGRFGADAYPHRVLMADLPEGATLIPNPVNQVPGFMLREHWFLPGFPSMAWPMAEWVLERYYPAVTPGGEAAVAVWRTPESRLIPLMERLDGAFPGLKLFSLPHMGDDPADRHVLLGFRGRGDLDAAMAALGAALDEAGLAYGPPPQNADA